MNTPTEVLMPATDKSVYLPPTGTWPEAWYLLDGKSQDAIALAVACGRPLLVRGLPGTGKSDLARAAAEYLDRAFVYEVVTARTEPQDLLWRFDAIARLADAQVQSARRKAMQANPGNPRHYVSPGAMWWAINWRSAEMQLGQYCKTAAQCPDKELKIAGGIVLQRQRADDNGCVLLLDEIDKADAELPNSLLEVLGNTGFRLPWGGNNEIKADGNKPLIIVTTNEDRELPPAFVRRCLVINIEADADFDAWIKDRARVHFRIPGKKDDPRPVLTPKVLDEAAKLLSEDRNTTLGDSPKPGLAEYLDLLRGLHRLAPDDETRQLQWLERVAGFAYNKLASPYR
jgi:MoxR-like ATPase